MLSATQHFWRFGVAALLLAGCEKAALTVVDAGAAPDAAAPDAAAAVVVDAGSAEDAPAAVVDAGAARDAGFAADAPALDAATMSAPDAAPSELPRDAAASAPDVGIGSRCFADIFDPTIAGPNYDQFAPVVGSHCHGTNHQDITGVERVVFLGDSVTVGTPPTPHDEYYRSRLADRLAQRFNLEPPSDAWKRSSAINGTSLIRTSGDFASCAKFGARTDDLMRDNHQVTDCIPESERMKRTLVIMTIGGNDIASITKAGAPSGGRTLAEVRMQTERFVQDLRDTVEWLKAPGRFPNGVFVVFSNNFEFTDATGDVSSCPAAGLAGFDEAWTNPNDLADLVIWATEQYMRIAVDTRSDLLFMLETFCGHGYHNEDPAGRCYRGPSTPRWFDLTCIHPNPTGHEVIADMFMQIVAE